MGQLIQLKHKGLYTAPNEFTLPDGAMLRAKNTVINDDGVLEPRRGFQRDATLPLAADRATRYAFYQNKQIAAWSSGKLGYEDSGWTAYSGTYSDPDASLARRRFLLSKSNLYFTSSTGVYRLDAYNGTPTLSGMFKGLDISAATSGSSGFLATANQAAYRVVWGIKDANNNIIKGAPSGREVISNGTGGDRDVALTVAIPSGITTSHFLQLYRSGPSGGVAVEPDDELGLVYENNPTSGEISAGVLTVTDATPDSLRGETIYTAPSLEGILQSNDRPPLAWDTEEFEGSVIYANVTSKHRLFFTILAAGSGAITADDTITIAGTVYTAKSSETIASGFYKVSTGGTPATDIADTARSLVRVVNRYASNTLVYAYYVSGVNDLPGQILIEERGLGGSSFAIIASANGTAFNPVLPTSGTTVSSENDAFQNFIGISKNGLSEAVPLTNYKKAGAANFPILRVKKLGDSCFIFKQGEGIYRITGKTPSEMEIDLFDSSARLISPDSVAVVNNQIWCLTDQGITVVTETGVSVVSRPIEDLILDRFGSALTQVKNLSFGVGYETERKYILWVVDASTDSWPTTAFAFNAFTKAFTDWDISATCGEVSPVNDKLYIGDASSNYSLIERKDRAYTDFVDHALTSTVTSYSGTSVFMDTSEADVGDILYESASVNSIITAVEAAFVTVADSLTWASASVSILKSYECDWEYAAITGGNPGMAHHFTEASVLFRQARFSSMQVGFATDVSPNYEYVTLTGDRTGLWGLFPWGEQPWGGNARAFPIRTYVPREKQRGSFLRVRMKHKQGWGDFKLNGLSVPFRDTGSYRIGK